MLAGYCKTVSLSAIVTNGHAARSTRPMHPSKKRIAFLGLRKRGEIVLVSKHNLQIGTPWVKEPAFRFLSLGKNLSIRLELILEKDVVNVVTILTVEINISISRKIHLRSNYQLDECDNIVKIIGE